MDESSKLLSCSNVRHRFKRWWYAKDGSHSALRSMVIANVMVSFIVNIGIFKDIRQAMDLGQLPWFSLDLIITLLAVLEIFVAVSIGGVFRRRRRDVMIAAMLQLDVIALLLLAGAGDDRPEGSGLCNGGTAFEPPGLTARMGVRLAIYLVVLASTSLALCTAWTHGLAYMHEFKSEGIIKHYGILVLARVVGVMMFSRIFQQLPLWLLTIAVTGQLTVHILQMFRVPAQVPGRVDPIVYPGFFTSLGRVLSNGMAMSQMFATGFVLAALWGFGWYERDIVRTKYLMEYTDNWMCLYSDILRYHFIVLAVFFVATKYSPPLMLKLSNFSVTKMTTVCTFAMIPLFLVTLMLLRCRLGDVAGLTRTVYRQPGCSLSCGCAAPFDSLAPVCDVETMTTYLSPCHAGCSTLEHFSGLPLLTNCTCGGVLRRMSEGGCAESACRVPFELHKLFYVLLTMFTVLTLQTQGVLVLRLIDERDTSVGIGVMSAIIALVAFVGGNATFLGASAYTCMWQQGGRCQLHNSVFPNVLAGLCSGFTLIAFIINLVTLFVYRKKEKKEKSEEIDQQLSSRIENIEY